jgi:PEP-CTERM motif
MSLITTICTRLLSRKGPSVVILAACLAMLTGGPARANLVTNGGFELYTGTPPKDFSSNVLPTDWSVGGYVFIDAPGTADDVSSPGIPVYGPFPATSPQGGNFVESDGSVGLAFPINQTISGLTAGQNYTVSFYQAAGQQVGAAGATTEQWQVSLGSQTQLSALMSIPQGGVFPWESQSLTFNATSSSEVLSFLAIGSGGVPPIVFLDGVDMEANVPEPSAFMLLAGVGAVCATGKIGRRLRARSSAA